MPEKTLVEKIITGIGSTASLVIHTALFVGFFLLSLFGFISWDEMLIVLTTIVSLEAIYLAIFIQMTVNRQAQELAEVSEDVEDIQKDVEGIQEDVEDIQKDVEGIQEDVEEITEEGEAESDMENHQALVLEHLTQDIHRVLADLEQLKKRG